MEKSTPFTRKELLDWSVMEFKFNMRYIAWKNHTDEKYEKIVNSKK